MNTFDDINAILNNMQDDGSVEMIDDPSIEITIWEWAEVIGVVEEFVPYEYSLEMIESN